MKKIKINKRVLFILIITIICIILGILYPSVTNKVLIKEKVSNYIEALLNNRLSIKELIVSNINNNIIENIIMYITTIFLILFPISIIIYLIKVFSLGVSISSIIYIYKLKGLLYTIIINIPVLLNIIVLGLSLYYSITYIIIRIRYKNKISKKKLLKGYLKILIVTTVLQILISLIDSYLTYNIFKIL